MNTPHPDYMPIPPSPREMAAIAVAELVAEVGLLPGAPNRSSDKKYRYVTFCEVPGGKPCAGEVRIYSESYFSVFDLSDRQSRLYDSIEAVAVFLSLKYVRNLPDDAEAIPQRQAKPKKVKAADPDATQTCGPSRQLPIQPDMFGEGNG